MIRHQIRAILCEDLPFALAVGLAMLAALLLGGVARGEPPAFVVENKLPQFAVVNKACVCGDSCKCALGKCPGGCPLATPVMPAAPAVRYRTVQVCDGGKCRIITLDPTFTPPGFGTAPTGMYWYKAQTGWALYAPARP